MHYRLVKAPIPERMIKFIHRAVAAKVDLSKAAAKGGASVKATSGAGKKTAVMMNKCATIPELARLLEWSVSGKGKDKKKIDFSLGVDWMKTNQVWTVNLNSLKSPYHAHLKMLTASCPKLRAVDNILREQLSRQDFLGRPAKGIIFTKHNEAALIIFKYLVQEYSHNAQYPVRPVVVYGGMPKNERQQAAHDFQYGDEINVIIGISEALGTGLTLTRAQYMILVEQEGDPGIHEQKLGRILRQSNYNWLGLNIFELYSDNYSWEKSVAARRMGRERFANAIDEEAMRTMTQQEDGQQEEELDDEDNTEDMEVDKDVDVNKDPEVPGEDGMVEEDDDIDMVAQDEENERKLKEQKQRQMQKSSTMDWTTTGK